MKKALTSLLALLLMSFPQSSRAELRFNLRNGKAEFGVIRLEGVKVLIAPELSPTFSQNKALMSAFFSKIFRETKLYMPGVLNKFNSQGYKVMLFQENVRNNGLEFVRPNQHRWDERIDRTGFMNKSILILNTTNFMRHGNTSTFYVVHELAHFRHLCMSPDYTPNILAAYNTARRNNKYIGMYAGSNHLEYFADISATYLLPSRKVPRANGFPKGKFELSKYDNTGYRLCKSIWGEKGVDSPSITFTPPRRTSPPSSKTYDPPRRASGLGPYTAKYTPIKSTRVTSGSDNSGDARNDFYDIKDLIEKGEHHEFHAHIYKRAVDAREAKEYFTKAYDKLIIFNNKYPNWNNNLASKKIPKIRAKITKFKNF